MKPMSKEEIEKNGGVSRLQGKTLETVICGPRSIIVTAPNYPDTWQMAVYIQTEQRLLFGLRIRKRQLARTIRALQRVHDQMSEEMPSHGWTMPSPKVPS